MMICGRERLCIVPESIITSFNEFEACKKREKACLEDLSLVSAYHRRRRRLVRHPNSIWASTNQGQGRGSINLPPRGAALLRFDAGSVGVKPTSSCIIQNLQTSCSSCYMMYET